MTRFRSYWYLRAKWKEWQYERKYGIPIEEKVKVCGKIVVLNRENGNANIFP